MERPITSTAGMDGAPGAGERFVYCIDAENRLSFVAADWLRFARDNEAKDLSTENVQGKPLFDFVADPETQHLYKAMIDKVRRTHARVIVPFRCDSPDMRRFMVLHISPLPDDGVRFEGKLVRVERREPVALLDSTTERSEAILVSCSWCKRIQVGKAWLEVEEAIRRLGLFDQNPLPQISHGICGGCMETFDRELEPQTQG